MRELYYMLYIMRVTRLHLIHNTDYIYTLYSIQSLYIKEPSDAIRSVIQQCTLSIGYINTVQPIDLSIYIYIYIQALTVVGYSQCVYVCVYGGYKGHNLGTVTVHRLLAYCYILLLRHYKAVDQQLVYIYLMAKEFFTLWPQPAPTTARGGGRPLYIYISLIAVYIYIYIQYIYLYTYIEGDGSQEQREQKNHPGSIQSTVLFRSDFVSQGETGGWVNGGIGCWVGGYVCLSLSLPPYIYIKRCCERDSIDIQRESVQLYTYFSFSFYIDLLMYILYIYYVLHIFRFCSIAKSIDIYSSFYKREKERKPMGICTRKNNKECCEKKIAMQRLR